MGDDGMLFNFSTAEPTSKYQQKFKGGTWKERLIIQRLSRHRQQRKADQRIEGSTGNKAEYADGIQSRSDLVQRRPVKRRKESGEFKPAVGSSAVATPAATSRDHTTPRSGNKPREVISSLFSYNPKPETAPDQSSAPQNEVSARPSNAALVDGADTFSSLGLSSVIANHLITKLGLKAPTAIQKSSISHLLQDGSDTFIQAETGSGKTLAYLLPILQRLTSLSAADDVVGLETGRPKAVHRDSGIFAIIIAPTRELCKQISVVLERLLGCAHWLVTGLNILVATPGRLADHLENTRVLNVSNVRWLVLDEGDRLMDLGFEEDIQKIIRKLDAAQKRSDLVGLPLKRTTILCSATMKMNVQRLGEISLKEAALIKADDGLHSRETGLGPISKPTTAFYAPAQLKQSYTVVAAKLRLVALSALLKRTFARKGSVMKAIVFFSCADSVDFHYDVFTRTLDPEAIDESGPSNASTTTAPSSSAAKDGHLPYGACPTLFPNSPTTNSNPLTIYKLHGSLPQSTRTSIIRQFSSSTEPSLLLATDVASRGLDLPNLNLVIEYDPAFSSDDHLHRIGRTARLGRDGRAIIFLQPGSEEGYVEILRSAYQPTNGAASESLNGHQVTHTPCTEILKRGFSSVPSTSTSSTSTAPHNWESQATAHQLSIERWVLSSPHHTATARRAFQSHLRAYATHVSTERKFFDIKALHLGHLAKAFGLRERPGGMAVQGVRLGTSSSSTAGGSVRRRDGDRKQKTTYAIADEPAQMKMKRKMREMESGRAKGAAEEFNIA